MAYIRRITRLPSGKISRSYVIGGPDGLINFDGGTTIPYCQMREWFRKKTDEEIKGCIEEKLDLHGEELDWVCKGLFNEREQGEWDKPFDFEERYK